MYIFLKYGFISTYFLLPFLVQANNSELAQGMHSPALSPEELNLSVQWGDYQVAELDLENTLVTTENNTPAMNLKFSTNVSSSPYRITLFHPQEGEDGERLFSQTMLIAGLGPAVAAGIALLPEDISQWDKSELGDGSLREKWKDNVSSGPVWDNDKWYINYIGHPYFGGVYYQVARKSGYNQWNSVTYSFLMSAFYWEYGLEAFAEIPAIQDLIVTPLGGWIYGEWAFHKEKEIRANNSLVWGSSFWGSTALFFLDPVDNIGVGLNKLFGKGFIKTGSVNISQQPLYIEAIDQNELSGYWGINIQLLTH